MTNDHDRLQDDEYDAYEEWREEERRNPGRMLIPRDPLDAKWLTNLPPGIIGTVSAYVTEAILFRDQRMLEFVGNLSAYWTAKSGTRAKQIERVIIGRAQANRPVSPLSLAPDHWTTDSDQSGESDDGEKKRPRFGL